MAKLQLIRSWPSCKLSEEFIRGGQRRCNKRQRKHLLGPIVDLRRKKQTLFVEVIKTNVSGRRFSQDWNLILQKENWTLINLGRRGSILLPKFNFDPFSTIFHCKQATSRSCGLPSQRVSINKVRVRIIQITLQVITLARRLDKSQKFRVHSVTRRAVVADQTCHYFY